MENHHQEFSRLSGSETIVIFVHGIQGSPQQFRFLTENIPENIDFISVLLPGHGGTVSHFRKCGRKEWTESFSRLCADLQKRYQKIYFVGHSMGCLIGIDGALHQGVSFEGMLLLACPLKIRINFEYFATCFRAMRAKDAASDSLRAIREANSVEIRNPLEMLSCVRPYGGLLSLILQCSREFRKLRTTICMIQSDHDEIVSGRSLRVAADAPNLEAITVPGSGHFYYSPEAKAIVRRRLQALLAESQPPVERMV